MSIRQYHRIIMVVVFAGLVAGPFVMITMGSAGAPNANALPLELAVTEQIVIFATAFVVKPIYQIFSLTIAILLWKRTEPELAALRRAMLAFFIGENACALNYLMRHDRSLLLEFMHAYGMVVCFGLVFYMGLEALDNRVFNFSQKDKRCVLLSLCGRCYKYSLARCNLRLLFLFIIPATAVMAAVPLTAHIGSSIYTVSVFGRPVTLEHPVAYQLMEARFFPLVSLVFFALSFILLSWLGEEGFTPSKLFFAVGMGPLGFSMLRFLFYWGYRQDLQWAAPWEEITEFLFITLMLWIVLRIRKIRRVSGPGLL